MLFQRFRSNPLLTPSDVQPTRSDLKVLCALNPAAVRIGEETILLVRVGEMAEPEKDYVTAVYFDPDDGQTKIRHIARTDPNLDVHHGDSRWYFYKGFMLLTSMSHLRIARSRDGQHFTFDPQPFIFPATPYEAYGCEDARITAIEGRYLIAYTAVSSRGVTVAMAETADFRSVRRLGIIFPPYQKDVAIFPEKVRGRYVCRHRPFRSALNEAAIWTAYSPDLECWGRHDYTLGPVENSWQADRVGGGAAPLRTKEGWLDIYHGADRQGRYCLGAMLTDLEQPHRLISYSRQPVLEPTEPYEIAGVYGHCVFSNGLLEEPDGTLTVFYGAADRVCAAAVTTVDRMVAAARNER